MNLVIRVVRISALVAAMMTVGLALRWATAGTTGRLSTYDFGSLVGMLAAVVAWSAYAWLCLTALVTVLEQVPGALGQAAAVISAAISSNASRTLLRSALGVAAAAPLTVVAAHADSTTHASSLPPAERASSVPVDVQPLPQVQRGATVESANWDPATGTERPSAVQIGAAGRELVLPQTAPNADLLRTSQVDAGAARLGAVGTSDPSQRRRDHNGSGEAEQPQQGLAIPDRPTAGAPVRYTPIHPAETRSGGAWILVRPGDSLWSIAGAELGPGAPDTVLASRCRRLYAVNAERIGPDPGLIYPGQFLKSPERNSHPNQER
jgi:hypothetical protein